MKKRLTRKTMFGDYGLEEETNQDTILNTLGKLEDIEEELGIDLITLFKALKNGVWWKTCEFPNGHFAECYRLELDIYLQQINIIDNYSPTLKLTDYGKTWALTKGELENYENLSSRKLL